VGAVAAIGLLIWLIIYAVKKQKAARAEAAKSLQSWSVNRGSRSGLISASGSGKGSGKGSMLHSYMGSFRNTDINQTIHHLILMTSTRSQASQ